MGQMSDLMGEDDRREELEDFVRRYEAGTPPHDDIPGEEALARYREAVTELSGDEYRNVAREVFEKLSSEERVEFGRQLRDRYAPQGQTARDAEQGDERLRDPDLLAQFAERVHREQPGALGSLLDGGGAGLVGGMMGGGMTGGEGASGGGGMLGNPVAKIVVADIAVSGIKKTTDLG